MLKILGTLFITGLLGCATSSDPRAPSSAVAEPDPAKKFLSDLSRASVQSYAQKSGLTIVSSEEEPSNGLGRSEVHYALSNSSHCTSVAEISRTKTKFKGGYYLKPSPEYAAFVMCDDALKNADNPDGVVYDADGKVPGEIWAPFLKAEAQTPEYRTFSKSK